MTIVLSHRIRRWFIVLGDGYNQVLYEDDPPAIEGVYKPYAEAFSSHARTRERANQNQADAIPTRPHDMDNKQSLIRTNALGPGRVGVTREH